MQVDCSPTSPAGYIRAAQANSQVRVVDLLAELFDNSIDAGATRIEAEVSKKKGLRQFRIRDNGPGISGLAKLMLLGESDKAGGEQSIGRWGVGAKDCIFGVGGLSSTLTVEAATRYSAWRADIVWREQSSWRWEQEVCDRGSLGVLGETGTTIQMVGCHRQLPQADDIRRRLSKLYWPWFGSGRDLLVNEERVVAPDVPRTSNHFPEDGMRVDVDENRSFTISGGVIEQADDDLAGVTVFSGNRSVMVASSIGCDGRGDGIFALVRLSGSWDLDRNKIGLSDDHRDDLEDALEPLLKPILSVASDRARELDAGELMASVNAKLAGLDLETGGAKRPNKGTGGGPREEPDPDREPRRKVGTATTVGGPGDVKSRSRRSRRPYSVRIVASKEDWLAEASIEDRCVKLNKNHGAVASMLDARNEVAILVTAASMLANELAVRKGGLPFGDRFPTLVSLIVAGQTQVAEATA